MRRPSGRVRRGKLAEMDRCKFTALLSILIVLLPCASVGGTVDYECVIILNGTCTELLPDWDVDFPKENRSICLPSMAATYVVDLEKLPTQVMVCGSSDVVGELNLTTSCYRRKKENWVVHIGTDDLFANSSKWTGEFYLKVDGETRIVQYQPFGVRNVAGESLTVNLEDSDVVTRVIWRIFSSSALDSSEMKLCVRDEAGRLQNAPTFLDRKVIMSANEFSCVTDTVLLEGSFAFEVKIQIKREGAKPGSYRLELSTTGTCSGASSSSGDLTLKVDGVVSPSTTFTSSLSLSPTSTQSFPPTPGGGGDDGLTAGEVAAIVVIVLIVLGFLALILILVPLIIFKLRKHTEKIHTSVEDSVSVGKEDKSVITEALIPKQVKVVAVLNALRSTLPDTVKLAKDLSESENSELEEIVIPNEDEDITHYYRGRVNSILSDLIGHCYVRLYIIYKGSPEELHESCPPVWQVMKEIKTRPYALDKLKKVVFIQVISESVSESRILDDYVQTIFVPESKICDPKTKRFILSKLRLDKRHNDLQGMRTPGRNEAAEEVIDGELGARTSPEESPGPYHDQKNAKSRTFDYPGIISTEQPINCNSHLVPQTGILNREQREDVGTAPQASANVTLRLTEPPPYSSAANHFPAERSPSPSQNPAKNRNLDLAETQNIDTPPEPTADTRAQESNLIGTFLSEVKKQTDMLQSIEKNTRKTADHTEGVREDVDEIKKTTNNMSDDKKREEIPDEPMVQL